MEGGKQSVTVKGSNVRTVVVVLKTVAKVYHRLNIKTYLRILKLLAGRVSLLYSNVIYFLPNTPIKNP